jgi:DNA repair ATPase RecN
MEEEEILESEFSPDYPFEEKLRYFRNALKEQQQHHAKLHQERKALESWIQNHPKPQTYDEAWLKNYLEIPRKLANIQTAIGESMKRLDFLKEAVERLERGQKVAQQSRDRRLKEAWRSLEQKEAQAKAFQESQKTLEENKRKREEARLKAERSKIIETLATIEKKERKSQ